MFLHLSVILSTGGGVSGRHPQAYTPLGRHPPWETPPLGRHLPGRHHHLPGRQRRPLQRTVRTLLECISCYYLGALLIVTSILLVLGTRSLHMHFYYMYILPIYPVYKIIFIYNLCLCFDNQTGNNCKEIQWRIYIVKFWTRAPPPGSKFFQFHAVFGKIWQNHMLAPPPESWRPLLGEILDPPLKLLDNQLP